jgi:predicted PurR-regulated permease PerM
MLALIATFVVLHLGREFFLPIAVAIMLKFLLAPAVGWLKRFRLPEAVGAALVLLALLVTLGLSAYTLATPLQGWLANAPQSLAVASRRMKQVLRPVEAVNRAAEQVENVTTPGAPDAQEVVVRGPRLSEQIFGTTQSFVIGLLEMLVLLYFLLATGDLFLLKLVRVLPGFADKKKAITIARETSDSISAYLGLLFLINVGLGLVVTLVVWALGLPNPLLWGAAAAVLEFLPYIGAATMTAVLTVAGLVTFPDLPRAFLIPGAYVVINLIQANFIGPFLLARRLTLNPVALFVGFLFWFWIWGVGGALLSVPLLATLKILCDHVERLKPVGEFLGR